MQALITQLSMTLQSRDNKQKETSTMSKHQLTTWACGHIRPSRGSSPSDNPCSECKARGADYYRPRQGHRKVDFYRPIYGRRRGEENRGGSGVWNARSEKHYNEVRRREEDDRRKRRKIYNRQSQREREQYEEERMRRKELAREQDQYEEARERQQDEEYCPCDRCWAERRVNLDSKIHKWLTATEESLLIE